MAEPTIDRPPAEDRSPEDAKGVSLAADLLAAAERALGARGRRAERLSGGASMETWLVETEDGEAILRRAPGRLGDAAPEGGSITAIPLAAQAAVINLAAREGVKAPRVLGALKPEDGLGDGFFMARASGEALPAKLLRDPRYHGAFAGLTEACARELAKIHQLPIEALDGALPHNGPAAALEELARLYDRDGGAQPILALGLGWLERNLPEESAPAPLHGDFRLGNLMIDETGLSAVLDWELAHLGDPAQDLAYLCAPSWRFGRYDKPVGGFGDVETLLAAYQAQGGAPISEARFGYWLVYACLQWALICLTMIRLWREKIDRSLERVVVGTRVSEAELDLLLLIEEAFRSDGGWPRGDDERIEWPAPARAASPQGGSSAEELAVALGEWIDRDVAPEASGRTLFQARVARNALGIVRRRAAHGAEAAAARRADLRRLGLSEGEFSEALRERPTALRRPGALASLRRDAALRLMLDQPKYAGLAVAKAKWSAA